MKNEKSKVKGMFTQLAGSHKKPPLSHPIGTLDTNEIIQITIRLRRKKSVEQELAKGKRFTHEEYEKNFGASDEDISLIEKLAHENHLTIVEINPARRSVILGGRIRDFENVFKVTLSNYSSEEGKVFRGRSGHIYIPSHLDGIIEGVFGLDDRTAARPMFRMAKQSGDFSPHTGPSVGLNPNDVGKVYGFPQNVNGAGQCIAIIELGGGYKTVDLNHYFASLGLTTPNMTAISVNGATNHPTGNPNGPDGEVVLDIEVAGAIAPGAKIAVYFAPNTDAGFLNAITSAIHDKVNKPSVISISWGSAEIGWTQQALTSYNQALQSAALLGITVCVAAGDDGSNDDVNDGNVHVDFPASSPYSLACGGTKLTIKSNKVSSEVVWNESTKNEGATGGGVSNFFAIPGYQTGAGVPVSIDTKFKGRGLPDVAGNADPETGFKVTVDGQTCPIGGTSAVAPLMAGLIALLNQKKGTKAGFINPVLYTSSTGKCRNISKGNNITAATHKGYHAGPGWDACTGWGVLFNL